MSMKSLAKEAPFPVRSPTIMFHPPNGYGLGHVNRLAAIALAVRKRHPAAALPFVLRDGNHSLLETASLPYVYLTARTAVAGGTRLLGLGRLGCFRGLAHTH